MKVTRWLALLLLFVGCPGDYQGPKDTSYQPYPDGVQQGKLDQYPSQWPDQYVPPPDQYVPPPEPDLWVPPADTGYIGSNGFGCQQDSDCFGLVCCETPWGVRLCKEVCTEQ